MPMTAANEPNAPFQLAARRAWHRDLTVADFHAALGDDALLASLESYDLVYRTLCGILYNFVPTSGHPGGSISSGRIVASILFGGMDYDIGDPQRPEADLLSYAAGHKAMGLYAMWALRNEMVRTVHPGVLPVPERQLRLEDLLGFRRNPTTTTPLFRQFKSKPLDGHPTPATPFVKLSTGASGVGVPASLGLAFGALDTYGPGHAPRVHILEGEGGMTAGRVSEALAIAATAGLDNAVLHLDFNQASIDSNRVCRDETGPGDYVQWDPAEMLYLHDWNLVRVADGKDFRSVLAAQRLAAVRRNAQPTGIVYRTVKGWRYGIEGKTSHGAGHKLLSPEYYASLEPCEQAFGVRFPRFEGEKTPDRVERCFWETLLVLRGILEKADWARTLADAVLAARTRLGASGRAMAADRPNPAPIYAGAIRAEEIPAELQIVPGTATTLRGALGDALNYLNRETRGAIIGGAADLLGSTSVSNLARGFPAGFFHSETNPGARLVACGGIAEDAMGAFMTGVSAYGHHVGAGASYGAFIAALEHVPARLHAIGQQARHDLTGEPARPFILICAHAGLKTGEDGPTHADPQALQLLQENFPRGAAITLTPWEPQELWPLLMAALRHRPAIVAPFVTRPNEIVPDRLALGLPPATAAAEGIYALRRADPAGKPYHGTVVLQESGVAYEFVRRVLPEIDRRGLRLNVFYVSSVELFDLLPETRSSEIFPPALAQRGMGITGFTLPTLYRWVRSEAGIGRSLHPFRGGRYPGSGQAEKVLEEAGLDGESQLRAVLDYAASMEGTR
jgi:transketolase